MPFLHLLELFRLLLVVLKDTDAAFEYDIEGVTVIILIHHEVTLLLTFNPAVLHYLRVEVIGKIAVPVFLALCHECLKGT